MIFSGEVLCLVTNKQKKVFYDFEPLKPATKSVYLCDNRFHPETLLDELSIDEKKFGFIIIDGKVALFGTLQGAHRQVLKRFSVDLPPKHSRGGQSANRFSHLRDEKRHNYLRKVAEAATECFIEKDLVNVYGLVLAGSADLKVELGGSDLFDQRLKPKILKYVDIGYGDEAGFNEAIKLAADCLQGVEYLIEKTFLNQFFDEIARDTGLYCFGINDTLKALEAGVAKTLILWDNLDVTRLVLYNKEDEKVLCLKQNNNLETILSKVSPYKRKGTFKRIIKI